MSETFQPFRWMNSRPLCLSVAKLLPRRCPLFASLIHILHPPSESFVFSLFDKLYTCISISARCWIYCWIDQKHVNSGVSLQPENKCLVSQTVCMLAEEKECLWSYFLRNQTFCTACISSSLTHKLISNEGKVLKRYLIRNTGALVVSPKPTST